MTIEIRPAEGFEDLERWVATRNEVVPDDPDDATMIALLRASLLDHVGCSPATRTRSSPTTPTSR